jgi:hypothetical protein
MRSPPEAGLSGDRLEGTSKDGANTGIQVYRLGALLGVGWTCGGVELFAPHSASLRAG